MFNESLETGRVVDKERGKMIGGMGVDEAVMMTGVGGVGARTTAAEQTEACSSSSWQEQETAKNLGSAASALP